MRMKLLVSVVNKGEVPAAIEGGAEIIDIKNPNEGSLGAASPWIIRDIIDEVGSRRQTSCAIGDVPNLPGTVSLAAAGAAALHPDYVKIGLLGAVSREQATKIMTSAVRAVQSTAPAVKVIACGYGDWTLVGSFSPLDLPAIACASGSDGILIDTINKDGRSLFDFLGMEDLKEFVGAAADMGLMSALAGSLRTHHASLLKTCSPDVVGIRGAACSNNDRSRGQLTPERIRAFRFKLG